MPPPIIPPEATDAALAEVKSAFGKLAEPWSSGSSLKPEESMAVLGDYFQERKNQPSGVSVKEFGKNSIAVKKDLLNKNIADPAPSLFPDGADYPTPSEYQTEVENSMKKDSRRHQAGIPNGYEGDGNPERSDNVTLSEPITTKIRKSSVNSSNGVYGPEHPLDAVFGDWERLEKHDLVAGPDTKDKRNDRLWKNLMKDAAFPAVALAAGGVMGAAKKADASEKPLLKPASAPQVNWDGVTQHLVDNENMSRAAGIEASPDIFPETKVQPGIDSFFAQNPTPLNAAMTGVKALEKNVIDPAIGAFQENVGRPLLDKFIDSQRQIKQGVNSNQPADIHGAERIIRAGGKLFAGKKQYEDYSETPKAKADAADLVSKVGLVGGAALETGMQMVGASPLLVVKGPNILKVTGEGKVASLAQSVVHGAAYGAADPDISIGEGAAFAGGMHIAAEGASSILGKYLGEIGIAKTAEAPKGSIFKKGNPYGKISDAEVLAKNPKMAEEGKLVGVITRDGVDAITQDIAKAPAPELPVAKVRKQLGGGKPNWATVTVDDAGNPIVKLQWTDPTNPMKPGEVISSVPFTVENARSIKKDGTVVTIAPEYFMSKAEPDYKQSLSAIFGQELKLDVPVRTGTPEELAKTFTNPVNAANRDYLETSQAPVAMETRLQRGMPRITPVFQGEVRLPDEEAPTQIWGYGGPERKVLGNLYENQLGFKSKQVPTQMHGAIEETRSLPIGTEHTLPGTTTDAMKIGVKPMFGGGSGGKPPSGNGPKMLPAGGDPYPLMAQGSAGIEKPVVDAPTWDNARGQTDPLEYIMSRLKEINADKGLWDKNLDALIGRHLRGPVDQATFIQSYQATTLLQRASEDILAAQRRIITPNVMSALDKDLGTFFKGNMTWGNLKGRNPEVTEQARRFASNLFEKRDFLDKELQKRGVVPEDHSWMRANGLEDLYMTRRYMAFAAPPGWWPKRLMGPGMRQTLKDGVKFILEAAQKRNPEITGDEVLEEVTKIIRSKNALASFKNSTISQPFASVLQKKNVPEPIRKLLGEVESGMMGMAMTLGTQDALLAKVDLLGELAKNPRFSSNQFNPALGHIYQLPDHGSMFAARNKYTNQHIFEAVGNTPKLEAASHAIVGQVLGFLKGNQVALGGIGPILNSTFGNLQSGICAGGLDLTRPRKSGASFQKAFTSMRDYYNDPTGMTGDGWIVEEAKRVGADFFGFGHEEIGSPRSRKWYQLMEGAFPANKPTSIFEAWGKLNSKMFNSYRDFQSHAGVGLDLNDRLFRMQSYIALREKFLADLGKNGDNSALVRSGLLPKNSMSQAELLDPSGKTIGFTEYQKSAAEIRAMASGMVKSKDLSPQHRAVLEAAARLASRQVNKFFWNPSFIGPALDNLRRGMGGILTTYATATFEAFRVNATILKEMTLSLMPNAVDPGLKWRIAAAAMAVAGAKGVMSQMNCVDDSDVEAAKNAMPKSKLAFRPFQTGLCWRDDKGRPQLWNWTQLHDLLRYGSGHPDDPMWRRVATNLALSPIEGREAGSFARDLATDTGFVRPTSSSQPTSVSQQGAMQVLQHVWKAGMAPGLSRSAYEAVRRNVNVGGARPNEEPLTNAQSVVKGVGVSNLEPVDITPSSPSKRASNIEYQGEIKGSLADQKRANRTGNTAGAAAVQEDRKRIFKSREERTTKPKK